MTVRPSETSQGLQWLAKFRANELFGRLPDGASRSYTRLLNIANHPFASVNYIRVRPAQPLRGRCYCGSPSPPAWAAELDTTYAV